VATLPEGQRGGGKKKVPQSLNKRDRRGEKIVSQKRKRFAGGGLLGKNREKSKKKEKVIGKGRVSSGRKKTSLENEKRVDSPPGKLNPLRKM